MHQFTRICIYQSKTMLLPVYTFLNLVNISLLNFFFFHYILRLYMHLVKKIFLCTAFLYFKGNQIEKNQNDSK